MSLKETWIDQDETMAASPEIPNKLADAIIQNEDDIKQLREDLDSLDVSGGGGDGDVDLSNYYTKEEVDNVIDDVKPFVVNVLVTKDDSVSVDKRYNEIIFAYNSGKTLLVNANIYGVYRQGAIFDIDDDIVYINIPQDKGSYVVYYDKYEGAWLIETFRFAEENKIGDIETALDNIIAIQNQLMGVSE